MKRLTLLLTLILTLALAGTGWCATIYVSPSGSNTSPYSSWTTAATTVTAAITYGNTVSGPHTVYIAPGTYTGNHDFSNSKFNGSTIQGTSASGVITPASMGQVILTESGSNHTIISGTSQTYNNISATNTGTGRGVNVGGANSIWNGCYFYDAAGAYDFYDNGSANVTLNWCRFSGANNNYMALFQGASGTVTLNYCLFDNSPNNWAGTSACLSNNGTTGTMTLNNCVFLGSKAYCLNTGNVSATTNFNNCILGAAYAPGSYLIYNTAGAVNLTNCQLISPWGTSVPLSYTALTSNVNPIYLSKPYFKSWQRTGYIISRTDDAENLAYVQAVQVEFAKYSAIAGYTMGHGFSVGGEFVAANQSALQTLINQGFSIVTHAWDEGSMNGTGTIWTISKPVGSTVGTMNISRTANTITLTDDSGPHVISNFRSLTQATIAADIAAFRNGAGNYWTNSAVGGGFNTGMAGEVIADSGGTTSTLTPQILLIDDTVTGMANNGSGLIRVTCNSHGLLTGDLVHIAGTVGTTEANNTPSNPSWTVTKIDVNTFDLQGSTFTNAWVSGGKVLAGNYFQEIGYALEISKSYLTNYTPCFTTPAGLTSSAVETAIKDAGYQMNQNVSVGGPNLASFNAYEIIAQDGQNWQTIIAKTATNTGQGASNGSGGYLIRVTTAANPFRSGDTVNISGMTTTTEANGSWTINVISTTQFDLVGSTLVNSGGSAGFCVDDTQLAAIAAGFADSVCQLGLGFNFLCHNANEFTIHEWDVVLAVWATYPNLKVVSPQTFINAFTAAPYSTADGVTYTRTWTDGSDYHLKIGSPLIKAGTTEGLTTDYFGNTVHNPPNIGIDDTQTFGSSPLAPTPSGWNWPGWRH